VAGTAIRNFRIDPSPSNRIESGRPILIRIESRSFAGPYLFLQPVFTTRNMNRMTHIQRRVTIHVTFSDAHMPHLLEMGAKPVSDDASDMQFVPNYSGTSF